MAKAVGIGGLFLEFQGDKEGLHSFYREHLGLDMSPYGTGFISGEQMMLLSFKRDFDNAPLINFRVDDLEGMLAHLRDIGLETDELADYEYGKFAHFTDPFGNYIELWEPYEEEYRKMVKSEIESYEKSLEDSAGRD